MSIFCHKCGKKLEVGDEFCQFCGAKVSGEPAHKNSTNHHKSFKREDLEKKPWYRALKVFYILAIVVTVLTIGAVSISTIPHKTLDGEQSRINCNNGTSYAPSNNSIYLYGKDLSSYDDKHARILCRYDSTNYYSSYYSGYIEKNYTFVPVYEEMKYGGWIGYTFLALFIAWLIFKVLRMGFFYIAIGEKPSIDISNI